MRVLGMWALPSQSCFLSTKPGELHGAAPLFPPDAERGRRRPFLKPIYAGFALTLWMVPVWTPDQLVVAAVLTGYCLIGPMFKQRRFRRMFVAAFDASVATAPYWIPGLRRRKETA